uniref:Ig-like domain-containing protein n=1 Tax=Sander lucioperca TaxID=283035 RepID=A0A8C9ZP01_SANLU
MTLHVNILINTCFYLPVPKVIKVEEGRDVILPCSLITKEDLQLTQFNWKKVFRNTDDDQKVFLYDKGDLYSDERPGQSEQFKGRVSHFPDELKQGNASIIIRNTTRADSGEYRCDFQSVQGRPMFQIMLDVGVLYSDGCPGQSEQFKGRVSHFPDELKQGNASITIRNMTRADSGDYRCSFPLIQKHQMFYIKLVVGEYFDERVKDVLSFKDWSLVSTLLSSCCI